MMRRAPKLTTLSDEVARLPDLASIALGGSVHSNRPAAFVRELIRQDRGKLTISSPGAGWDVDLLISQGLVRRTVVPMVTMAEYGMAPSFRAAVETGRIDAAYLDAMVLMAGYLAAAHDQPYHLLGGLEGTDIVVDNDLLETLTDTSGKSWRAVRAIRPDLCVLHVDEADQFGNVRHLRGRVADVAMARAARRTVVQAERIVDNEVIRAEPHRTTLSAVWVDAVVEAPFGAHPTATSSYNADEEHLRAYRAAAEEARLGRPALLDNYVRTFVTGASDERAYYDAVGGKCLEDRLTQEMSAASEQAYDDD